MEEKIITELTEQEKVWRSEFGEEYNHRNTYSNEELDRVFENTMGISRTKMNERFIGHLDRDIKILEVGCNIGMMLVNLQEMGFKNLSGIEIQPKAVEAARQRTNNIDIIEGSAYRLPFDDNEFDLIFTCHVLIHIPPENFESAFNEMVRCSRKFIYCDEYFAEEVTEIINYHGHNNIVWKRNFVKTISTDYPGLELLKEEKLKYTHNNNIETVFLYQKKTGES